MQKSEVDRFYSIQKRRDSLMFCDFNNFIWDHPYEIGANNVRMKLTIRNVK